MDNNRQTCPEILPFFGARRERDGSIGLGCLSQWWQSPFVLDGLTFQTAEHFMMHRKAVIFGDQDTAVEILRTQSPKEAKRLGRNVKPFDNDIWNNVADYVVTLGNFAKFHQHPELAQILLSTGDAILVEASPYDRVWGVGIAADDPRIEQPSSWPGANKLGIILMDVRTMLRERRPA